MQTDEELILSAQQGNSDSELELFSRYKNLLRKICHSYFLIGGDMEDLIQEGMIGLYKAIKNYKPSKNVSFATFAGICVKRQIQTAIKKATSHKSLVLSSAVPLFCTSKFDDEDEEECELILPSLDPTPDEKLISKETLLEMKQVIKEKLSVLEIKVLANYLRGETYEEISNSMGISKKSIDNALSRIKKKLEFLKHLI